MTVNKLPLVLQPWVPHAVTGQYRRDIVERLPLAFMQALVALHGNARPKPIIVAEMKSPRIPSKDEDVLREAMARAIHDLAVVWELPLEILVGDRPHYRDPGFRVTVRIERLSDPTSYAPSSRGPGHFYRTTIHRISASSFGLAHS